MGAAGTYQFVWSSIRPELGAQLAMGEQSVGAVFTLYILTQTLSQFPAGWFRDRFGPRLPLAVGAVLMTTGFVGTGNANAPWQVFLAYGIGGVGAGASYTVAVNTPVKWFEERRGLATGLVTMAYGGVSVLFIPSIRAGVGTDLSGTLTVLAAGTGGAALLGVFVLSDPAADRAGIAQSRGSNHSGAMGWRETVGTWQFWLLYLMLIVLNAVGLMIIGKAVEAAQHFGLGGAIATATASVIALSDSLGIVTIGGLSDRFGRERTIAATVTGSGIATGLAVFAGEATVGLLFMLLLGAAAFFRSPVFAITPTLVGEYYGAAHSSENYALLYTARVWGGIGGGIIASLLIISIGWSRSFLAGAVALVAVGILTAFLRPVDRANY